jgi:molybdopterin adenylyltransferase
MSHFSKKWHAIATLMENMKQKAAILIASSRAAGGERPDKTGPLLEKRLGELGYSVDYVKVVPDDLSQIESILRDWVNIENIPLILTSGGTGLSPDDVTPEATSKVIDRRIPGIEEAMRRESSKITPFGMLSRSVAGVAGQSLIINLPGNPDGALENLKIIEPVLDHALQLIKGVNPHRD